MDSLPMMTQIYLAIGIWFGIRKASSYFFVGRLPVFLAWFGLMMYQSFRPF